MKVQQIRGEPHESLSELYEEGLRLYENNGLPRGASTGWASVDELYTVAPGQVTVVTGIPGSGKSEWLDAVLVNLAETGDWNFCVYSPENFPTTMHLIKLVEKRNRKPFSVGPVPRMTLAEYKSGANWVLDRFIWLATALKSPEELIEAALSYDLRPKRVGIVLDPWNSLEHQRGGMTETDYISFILTEVVNMARAAQAHVWLVVHPAKIQRNRDGTRPVPSPYDLSGSAHWYNKADNIVTVHREQMHGSQEVDLHVQKVRFKNLGHVGLVTLRYDKVIGRYFEHDGPSIEGEFYADPQRAQTPPTFDAQAAAERAAMSLF